MRVIVVESDQELRERVTSAFSTRGHTVTPVDSVQEAARWIDAGIVDLVVSDLSSATSNDSHLVRSIQAQRSAMPIVVTTVEAESVTSELLKAVMADILRYPFSDDALDDAIEKAQAYHALHDDSLKVQPFLTERISFRIPSAVEFLDGVLNHISERLVKMRIVDRDSIEVVVALDEAIVNAIKHGNGYDASKHVTIVTEITKDEARFQVTDEGEGFSVQDVPDPCAPENLLRTSGRGILLIRSIMDEVAYNDRGNSLLMVKRAASPERGPRPNGGDVPGIEPQATT
jgi:serine/threonine-protein kinase RsbW